MRLTSEKIAYFVNNSNWIEGIETSELQIQHYVDDEKKDREGISPFATNHVDAVLYVLQTYDRTPTHHADCRDR